MYTEAYNSLGLSTIKQQYDDYTKQLGDLQNELNDKKQANQNNPWLSQGIVDKMNSNLDTKYADRIKTLTNLLTLTDSLYKQGTAQVDTMVSNANTDIRAANTLAQQQINAANLIARDNQIITQNGRQVLVNKESGKVVADLGPAPATSTMTLAEREALAKYESTLPARGLSLDSLFGGPASPSDTSSTDTSNTDTSGTDATTQAAIDSLFGGSTDTSNPFSINPILGQ